MIRILAHRGYWISPAERNGRIALRRAFESGFGVETDIRDAGGKLVVSHDMPTGGELPLEDMLDLIPEDLDSDSAMLALNIKADGLAAGIAAAMRERPPASWFVFDMSVPDLLAHMKAGLPAFTRISDYETEPVALAQAAGVWVDGFARDWTDFAGLRNLLPDDKMIALVSPELHGRDHAGFWRGLRDSRLHERPGVMICTDLPVAAAKYFRPDSA